MIEFLGLDKEDRNVESVDGIRMSRIPVSRLDAACRSHAAFLKGLVGGIAGSAVGVVAQGTSTV